MDERRGERSDNKHRIEMRDERREKRERMEKGETRENRQRRELKQEGREGRERMDVRRSRGREERQRIESREERREKRERMEILRSKGREEKQRTEHSGHRRDKRQRSEELRGHIREKRHRTELDADKRGEERIKVREERTEKRERYRGLGQRPTESPRERPKSISDLNRIYGGLTEAKEGVGRKKIFECMEEVNGRMKNILQGLELHSDVFDPLEQTRITEFVYKMQRLGHEGWLERHTYSAPRKWMRGKGRVTLQFGCCYNYAKDKEGNPPGIMRNAQVDPIPPLLKDMIRRMVKLQILPATCIPDSCIINIYDKGDCIPPHIDHKDFLRPFCTVSFLSEAQILFGQNLKVVGPGEFTGSAGIPLPCGSVLVLSGNGADVAKHCVPAVRSKRISITFRKMDDGKLA